MSGDDRTLPWGLLGAAAAGVAVSLYLTIAHFAPATLVCGTSGLFNCDLVTTSAYGVLLGSGLPTASAGLAWFGVGFVLAAVQLARPASPLPLIAHRAWSVLGIVFVLALVYIEVVILGAICIWCTVAHVLVLATLLMTLARRTPA